MTIKIKLEICNIVIFFFSLLRNLKYFNSINIYIIIFLKKYFNILNELNIVLYIYIKIIIVIYYLKLVPLLLYIFIYI